MAIVTAPELLVEKSLLLKNFFSFNNFDSSPAASKQEASATEGVPISFYNT